MLVNKLILQVPPTSNRYCHLNKLNFLDRSGNALEKVINASDVTITLPSGKTITVTPSGGAYSGYPVIRIFNEDANYWCSPGTGKVENLTLTFSDPVNINGAIAGISFRGDGGSASYRGTLTVEAYNDSELLFSNDITLPNVSASEVQKLVFQADFPIIIVKRGDKYYYRKMPEAVAIYLSISETKTTSTNGIELYSHTNNRPNREAITFATLDVRCNANSNHGILDVKVAGEVIKSVENIPSSGVASALPLDTITLQPGETLQFWGRWQGSHSGVTWQLNGETVSANA